MSIQNPNKNPNNKTLDMVSNVVGFLAIALLLSALGAGYFPQVSFKVILGMRYGGFALIAIYAVFTVILNIEFLKEMSKSRTTRNGANSLVLTIAFIGIIGLLNYFGTRYHHRIDLTKNGQFSISPQTKKILKDLKTDLKLTAFVQGGNQQSRDLKDLVSEYSYITPHLKLELLDPDREPGKIKLFFESHPSASRRTNVLMIENGDKLTEAQGMTEQDLTAAILKATQTKQPLVYLLQGHGELDVDGMQQDGMSQAKQALEKQNYQVQKLSLFETKNTIPADCDLLMVAGPKKPLMPQELEALGAYVTRGGKLYAMLTPGVETGLEGFFRTYGITVENDLVIDPRANLFGDAAAPVVQNYPSHAITTGLRPTIYPAARSLTLAKQFPAGVTLTSLVETSDQSFSKRDLKDRKAEFNAAIDKMGPENLMVAATVAASGSTKANRMLVVGNSQFIGNGFYAAAANGDLFVNSINWLAEQDNMVSIPPKSNQPQTLFLTNQQQNTIFLTSVAGAPAAMLFAGGFVWWRRRRS